jgi:hypothetical protein
MAEPGGEAERQNRLAIASGFGISEVPMEMRPGLSDQDKRESALSLNEHRRQLTAEDHKQLARRMRAEGRAERFMNKGGGTFLGAWTGSDHDCSRRRNRRSESPTSGSDQSL